MDREHDNPFAPPVAATSRSRAEPITAGPSKRLAGRLIDTFLMAASGVGGFVAAAIVGASPASGVSIGWLTSIVVQAFLISTRSQSLGKVAVGTMMIDRTGGPAGFVRGFVLRELPLLGLRALSMPALFGVFAGLDLVFILRDDRRCLHDYLGGTRVVEVARR